METDLKTFRHICYLMVKTIGRVLEKWGKKDLPIHASALSDTSDIDSVTVTSTRDEELFKKFEDEVHSKYSEGVNVNLYADKAYKELLEESDKIHEDVVEFFEYENGSPTTQIIDILTNTENQRNLIISSKDYLHEMREKVDPSLNTQKDEYIGLYK